MGVEATKEEKKSRVSDQKTPKHSIEVMRGLNEVIFRLESNEQKRVATSLEISDNVSTRYDYGSNLAIANRTALELAWCQQHGLSCPESSRIAIRVLSQTCTSSVCEHNWSTFDQIHSRRRNRMGQKRLNDLVYVHYDLRLRERQLKRDLHDPLGIQNIMLEDPRR
ncbi:hypothetical protein MRB53_028571 [Persea americana]|uniref:Uncharacterized protein n=1 Tax=Persea americana TaxID=3435 RepID=A0ACC2KGD3_PERAE|nr:hypothetical protein MRB53_028571 [Persea americana]